MIFLARHGETDYNAERRFQGQIAVPLNARGFEQAHELARTAARHPPFAALYASPVLRARQTAQIVAEALGLEPRFDARFAEHDVGEWQDRLFDDVEAAEPELWARWQAGGPDWAFPGGESLAQQQERVAAALDDVARAGELPALVVCHRGVIRSALCRTRPEGLAAYHEIAVPNGALVRL